MITLKLKNCDGFVYNYLPRFMKTTIANVTGPRTINMDNYLNSMGVEYTTVELLMLAVDTLQITCNKSEGTYSIQLNQEYTINSGKYKLESLIRLIDYGNLEVRGLDIMNKLFEYINKNAVTMFNKKYGI